jgi:hypothetical protein
LGAFFADGVGVAEVETSADDAVSMAVSMALGDGGAAYVGPVEAGPGAATELVLVPLMINVRATAKTVPAANTSPRRAQ